MLTTLDAHRLGAKDRDAMSSRQTGLPPVILMAAVAGVAGCHANAPAADGHTDSRPGIDAWAPTRPEGKCRFVTAPEMAHAVGVPAVKPVETTGGCSYLLDPTDVMPTWNIGDRTIPPLPPSIAFYYYTDKTGIEALHRDLSNPTNEPVNNLGAPAIWYDNDDPADELHELAVLTPPRSDPDRCVRPPAAPPANPIPDGHRRAGLPSRPTTTSLTRKAR
jgi:hypothetical protein